MKRRFWQWVHDRLENAWHWVYYNKLAKPLPAPKNVRYSAVHYLTKDGKQVPIFGPDVAGVCIEQEMTIEEARSRWPAPSVEDNQ